MSLFDRYLAGAAAAFYPGHFLAAEDRRRAVARAARPLAPAVADALVAQNARLAASPARDAHLEALRGGAAAVLTGQQVGLFLGPLFTLYKAASAIRLAQALRAETGTPVVPIFWLQTEDHDLPEIAACHVSCTDGTPRALALPADDARVPIAHRVLPDQVADLLAAVDAELGRLPHAAQHLTRLATHYRAGRGWADAFAGVLAELFADHGLVIVDPRDARLAAAAAPLHRRALEECEALAALLLERSAALRADGVEPGVHVRAAAPLSFFHPDGCDGARYRLAPLAHGFALVGGDGVYTRRDLLAALDAEPLRFSSSALLRPIVQDALLPTAAYVGGPAEVAYFAQLAPLYAAFELPMPLVVPRLRLRVVDARSARLLERFAVTPADAARPLAEILPGQGAQDAGPAAQVLPALDAALDGLRDELARLGPGAQRAAEKTRATVAGALRMLESRLSAQRAQADDEASAAWRRVQQWLYPNGQPQERVYGLATCAARFGEGAFVERVLAAAGSDATAVGDLYWNQEAR
ncbi:MAG: bacillithiol biosynthesis cysteine-adding enzyme BshC [Deltaproteobacteria bacterium]|nr:bacillithiol biosynthesis cysteine-adding enzyme BshC [Deltaproteobacteria bacterium]